MRASSDGGIWFDVMGDSGPFSKFGHSIGYRVRGKASAYLIDCGAPLFEVLTEAELRDLRGIIGTHSHDDHRRWFTDLALYKRYIAPKRERLRLITSETIQEEFAKTSRGALERSLTPDSKQVVEVPYGDFVEPCVIGPRARYRIRPVPQGGDAWAWRVVDADGEVVAPADAKVVIAGREGANRPRLLFRDPASGEWVEPESFYAYGQRVFYEENQNALRDEESGFEIRALKSPIWHGPPTIGVEIVSADERLVFSSDTVFNPDLWQALAEEYHPQRLPMGREAFEQASVIYGDINHFIERTWSPERLADARAAYEGATVIHDVGDRGSVVHTDYDQVVRAGGPFAMLTHSPDRFVSEYPLAITGKTFRVLGGTIFEEVAGELLELNADVYYRSFPHAYVGYRSSKGDYRLVDKGGYVAVVKRGEESPYPTKFYFDMYRDVKGQYLVEPGPNADYVTRPDGRIERVEWDEKGSRGGPVKNLRSEVTARRARERGAEAAESASAGAGAGAGAGGIGGVDARARAGNAAGDANALPAAQRRVPGKAQAARGKAKRKPAAARK
ncbi:MAG: hypothetical protein HZA54_05305, partial [Planctomycetes bacterium]|nr:hypothetical protein [Planctomycetota bacterium]